MKGKFNYWKKEFFHVAKKFVVDTVVYIVKDIIINFVEERLIKDPMKKIFSINKKWGWDDEYSF
mgnify:CR=1 FL=1|jgi:hypothetical protein